MNSNQTSEAIAIAHEIKLIEGQKPDYEAIDAIYDAEADALLEPIGEELNRLALQIDELKAPYLEELAKIDARKTIAYDEANKLAKANREIVAARRDRLAELLVSLKKEGAIPDGLVLVDKRELTVADGERAFGTLCGVVKQQARHKYLDVNEAGIELIAAMAQIKKGPEEEVHADLAANYPGFVLKVTPRARIDRLPEIETASPPAEDSSASLAPGDSPPSPLRVEEQAAPSPTEGEKVTLPSPGATCQRNACGRPAQLTIDGVDLCDMCTPKQVDEYKVAV